MLACGCIQAITAMYTLSSRMLCMLSTVPVFHCHSETSSFSSETQCATDPIMNFLHYLLLLATTCSAPPIGSFYHPSESNNPSTASRCHVMMFYFALRVLRYGRYVNMAVYSSNFSKLYGHSWRNHLSNVNGKERNSLQNLNWKLPIFSIPDCRWMGKGPIIHHYDDEQPIRFYG